MIQLAITSAHDQNTLVSRSQNASMLCFYAHTLRVHLFLNATATGAIELVAKAVLATKMSALGGLNSEFSMFSKPCASPRPPTPHRNENNTVENFTVKPV